MLESKIENDFRKHTKSFGLLYLKFAIFGMVGFPDRIILGSNRLIFFVEWKRTGATSGKRRGEKMQKYRHGVLRSFGFHVYILDSLEQAKGVLKNELGNRN